MPSGCVLAERRDASASVSHGKTGSDADTPRRFSPVVSVRLSALTLRRQILDRLRVVLGHADLRRAAGRAQLLEEVGVDLRVRLH